jgi:hypothetical protein
METRIIKDDERIRRGCESMEWQQQPLPMLNDSLAPKGEDRKQ